MEEDKKIKPLAHLSKPIIILFLLIVLVLSLGDAIMSYVSPVILENKLASTALMGLIMGSSSVFGIFTDTYIGVNFRQKSYMFFFRWAFAVAVLFPIALFLTPANIVFLVAAMAIWGIYYELAQFSVYHFINKHTKVYLHAFMWGTVNASRATAYAFGPILASFLLSKGKTPVLVNVLVLYAIGGAMLIFLNLYRHPNLKRVIEEEVVPKKRSLIDELRVWRIFGKRLWPILLFIFMAYVVDATFWSIGTLLSEEAKVKSSGGLILFAYGLPMIFMSILAHKFMKPFGKKRAAFISGFISSLFLIAVGFMTSHLGIMVCVLLFSVFISIAYPLMLATIEDYVDVVGTLGNDLIGLQSSTIGLAYIIGPLSSGLIAETVGIQNTFAIIGVLFAFVCLFCLAIVPRRMRMPQAELNAEL